MTSPTAPLPTFLIIGAQKSATRWLRSNLGEHPDVFASPVEISYFNQRFRRGPGFYRSQFEGWNGEPIVGEATPGYLMWRHNPKRVARRIERTVPDVRLIALLRNPIDRANSAMLHHVAKERVARKSRLVDLVTSKEPEDDRLGLVTGGWYAASLKPYIDLFGDQLLVLLHDDIADDPLGVYRRSLEHIGASPDFVPDELHRVVYSNQKRLSRRRKSKVVQKDREQLWPYFESDVRRLEGMVHRDLSTWDPTPESTTLPPPPANVVDLHRRTSEWVGSLIDAVGEDQLDGPTPCPDWTVADLLDHLINMVGLLTTLIGRTTYEELPEEALPANAAADPSRAYAAIIKALESELSDPLTLKQTVFFGLRLPAGLFLARLVVCQLGHGWDLAVATGQGPEIPAELAEKATDLAGLMMEVIDRAPDFGDEVPVAAGATVTDRFVAFLGRNPAVLAPA